VPQNVLDVNPLLSSYRCYCIPDRRFVINFLCYSFNVLQLKKIFQRNLHVVIFVVITIIIIIIIS
jgi:hypothetical protein